MPPGVGKIPGAGGGKYTRRTLGFWAGMSQGAYNNDAVADWFHAWRKLFTEEMKWPCHSDPSNSTIPHPGSVGSFVPPSNTHWKKLAVMQSMITDNRQSSRTLVVGDQPLIALDVHNTRAEAGFEIAGTVSTVGKAVSLAQVGTVDAAILGSNLRGFSAVPIAAVLSAHGLPYRVRSGYAVDQQPAELRAEPQVPKSFDPLRLIDILRGMLENGDVIGARHGAPATWQWQRSRVSAAFPP